MYQRRPYELRPCRAGPLKGRDCKGRCFKQTSQCPLNWLHEKDADIEVKL